MTVLVRVWPRRVKFIGQLSSQVRTTRVKGETVSRGLRLTLLLGVAVVVVVIAGIGWYYFIRDDAPPPLELSETTTTEEGATPSASGGSASPDGTWVVETGHAGADDSSVVGYRVNEKLASLPARSDAVGRTTAVEGTLAVDGTEITAVDITADLTELTSDSGRRDSTLRSRGLQTNDFPEATFTLTQPIELGGVPTTDEDITATATGDLTLHGVTQSVDVALDARWTGDRIEVVGNLPIAMAEYDIDPPNVAGFVDVDDNGEMEFQLFFVRA